MYRTLLVIVMVALLSGNAEASRRSTEFKPKSPMVATLLSMAFTVVPVVVGSSVGNSGDDFIIESLAAGTIMGPGVGHLYAGNKNRFLFGTCLRAAGCGLLFVCASGDPNYYWLPASLAGLTAFLSALIDVTTADDSAEKYNREHGPQSITVAPVFDPDTGEAGVQLSMRF